MKHIVERVLDGLPVFIQEDFPKFVELLRAYYTWQSAPDKSLGILYAHDALLDIDRDGLTRSIEELDETAVPPQFRRAWKMFAQQFNASRGSEQSWHDFFSIFFSSTVELTDSSQSVFMPSAARVDHYKRAVVKTTSVIPRTGILSQPFTGARADIVEASLIATRGEDRWYEVVVKSRGQDFYPGDVEAGDATGEFACFQRFKGGAGQSYQLGDGVAVSTALVTTQAVVASLKPVTISTLSISTPGTGYSRGDIVGLEGARGFRGEVASVGVGGQILSARIVAHGDPYGGTPVFTVDSKHGVGAVISFTGASGHPASIKATRPIWGDVTSVTSTSETGSGIAPTWEPYVFEEVVVRTNRNGLVGSGTRITDSAAWQDSSYTVTTPLGKAEWKEFATSMLHVPGRFMNAVKACREDGFLDAAVTADSHLRIFSTLSTGVGGGEALTSGLQILKLVSPEATTGESFAADIERTLLMPTSDAGAGESMSTDVTTEPV